MGVAWGRETTLPAIGGRQGKRARTVANAKLTDDAVRVIRTSHDTHEALAAQFKVSHTAIRYVRIRETWDHVE